MKNHLTAFVTTGPVSHPEAAWAKSIGLPHISLGASQVLGPLLFTIITVLIVVGVTKWLFN